MKPLTCKILLALALFASVHQAVAQTIQNPSFETPVVGSVGSYSAFQINPTGAGWTFTGNAGIAANGSGYAVFQAGTPDGNQFAFLQGLGGVGASMSQTISSFAAENYSFTFMASQRDVAGRDNSQNQTVTVLVDGVNVGSFTPADTNWYSFQTTPILLTAGNHVLTFTSLPVAGDATVLMDMVTVTGYMINYSVDWFKVAGGGGNSTGGVYTVTGTFGQQDAGGPMDGGGYSVEGGFWSLYGVQSSSATGNAPVINSQPQSVIIPPGNPASFTVSVTGTTPLLYQWQKNGANLSDGGNISGSTNATLTLSTTAFNDTGNYSVAVENAYGSVSSSTAKLTLLLPAYSITDIGYCYAYGINNSGQIVGESYTTGHAFLYSDGTMTNLGTLGGTSSYGLSINNGGQVAGYSQTGVIYPDPYYYYSNGYEYLDYGNIPQVHAFLYSGGTMTDLGVFGVSTFFGSSVYGQSYAYGINDSGQVAGYANTASGSTHAFSYSMGQLNDLDPLSGNQGAEANGINNSGEVVGYAPFGNFDSPASFNNGLISDLGTLGGTFGEAQSINNSGQVVGWSYTAGNGSQHAFLYSGGPLVDLGTFGGTYSVAFCINNSGQIVGYANTASGYEHAFLYTGGTMFDLNNLVNTNSIGAGFYFLNALGINDSGQIIANGNNSHAYLLTPRPPTSVLAENFPPKFQTMTVSGGNFQFNWTTLNSFPAVGYQVQYTTNLAAPNWINLGGVLPGTSATLSATNTIGTDPQRFYRVLLVQ